MNGKGTASFLVLIFLIFLLPSSISAQGWYWGSPVTPGYDRSSVVEAGGSVLEVDFSRREGPPSLRLESGDQTITVVLGPGWYLRQQLADIQVGDKLVVKGSKMKSRQGKSYLVAAWVKNMRTGRVLKLRDDNGRPLWSSKRGLEENIPEKKP
jgi:hypothetical protein